MCHPNMISNHYCDIGKCINSFRLAPTMSCTHPVLYYTCRKNAWRFGCKFVRYMFNVLNCMPFCLPKLHGAVYLLGQAWASPTLVGLHCKMRVYVILLACLLVAICRKFKIERTNISNLCTCHSSSKLCLTRQTPHYLTPRQWIYWMRQRTPHQVTQEESSVTFSRSIGVELDSEGSVMSTCTEH